MQKDKSRFTIAPFALSLWSNWFLIFWIFSRFPLQRRLGRTHSAALCVNSSEF